LRTLPGEQMQIDWGHFGHLQIGQARRPLMGFVAVLSYSRRIFLRFFLNARMDSLPQFEGKELFFVATYTVVLFSLLVQAPTLGPLLKKLRVCNPRNSRAGCARAHGNGAAGAAPFG
jgi:hypothetical protein